MTPTHLDRPDLGASDFGRAYSYQTACGLSGSRRPTERRPSPTEDRCPPLTINPDEVTCGSCRRSVYFRDLTQVGGVRP